MISYLAACLTAEAAGQWGCITRGDVIGLPVAAGGANGCGSACAVSRQRAWHQVDLHKGTTIRPGQRDEDTAAPSTAGAVASTPRRHMMSMHGRYSKVCPTLCLEKLSTCPARLESRHIQTSCLVRDSLGASCAISVCVTCQPLRRLANGQWQSTPQRRPLGRRGCRTRPPRARAAPGTRGGCGPPNWAGPQTPAPPPA